MDQENLYELIDNIPITDKNEDLIKEIKKDVARKKLCSSLKKNRNVDA